MTVCLGGFWLGVFAVGSLLLVPAGALFYLFLLAAATEPHPEMV